MMKRCTLRIELMSDMCVSDGSAYNSLLDIDICSDRYGFPFIPAKRIRGCLRECALELNEWGDSINTETLFGEKGAGSNRAKFRLSNAFLEDYDELKSFVTKHRGHVLTNPQNVLSCFSYARTQTSINYETGVADDNSLRTMRVADKGLVFTADVEVEEEYFEDLRKCCSILRHMGIARTRGLGEIKVTIAGCKDRQTQEHAALVPGAEELAYEIESLEPIICKNVNGGEANTMDYIEGSKILGLIAANLDEPYADFMSRGNLKCMNGYISKGGKRFTEVPGFIYKIKNNKHEYINKLAEAEEEKDTTQGLQINQMKHKYVFLDGNTLETADVMTEKRNHHRRPEDKSIGRADSKAGSDADFYQMDSISDGQVFAGRITGSPEQIEKVYDILTRDQDFFIGYSRSSEYGKVRIRVTETKPQTCGTAVQTNSVIVVLNAPAIVYNDQAMATTDPGILIREIVSALDISEEPKRTEKFVRNITLGGYNVTWNMRKPIMQAFDKGTAIRFTFEEPVHIQDGAVIMIGERTAEGYGETCVSAFREGDALYRGSIVQTTETDAESEIDVSSDFASKLARPVLEAYVRRKSVEAVSESEGKIKRKKSIYKPTVSNMMLMLKEASVLTDITAAVENRYGKKSTTKPEKAIAAEAILKQVEGTGSIAKTFAEEMGLKGLQFDEDELQMMFMKEYLTQIKYKLKGEQDDE